MGPESVEASWKEGMSVPSSQFLALNPMKNSNQVKGKLRHVKPDFRRHVSLPFYWAVAWRGCPNGALRELVGPGSAGGSGFSCKEHHAPQGILCLLSPPSTQWVCMCAHDTGPTHMCTWVVWSHGEAPVSVLPLPCPSWCPGLPLLLGEGVGGVWACRVAGTALTASVTRLSACRVPHSCLQGSCLHRTGSQSSPGRRQSAGTNTGDASFL